MQWYLLDHSQAAAATYIIIYFKTLAEKNIGL